MLGKMAVTMPYVTSLIVIAVIHWIHCSTPGIAVNVDVGGAANELGSTGCLVRSR